MRFALLGLTLGMILLAGSSKAQLSGLAASTVHLNMGKNMIVNAYIANPNSTQENITGWLGGGYPAGLARFLSQSGVSFTPDGRNFTVAMNPKEERVLMLQIVSIQPDPIGHPNGYRITLDSNTTNPSGTKDSESMDVIVDYSPSFPALEQWGIALATGLAGFAYWRLKQA